MNYPKLDSKTGRFLKTPNGIKTPKMLEMEKQLGVKFEDDYRNLYLSGKLGQKRFATKWNCSKSLIFANNLRGGRRSWVQMLNLPPKYGNVFSGKKISLKPSCECCGEEVVSLDNAHWVENKERGSNNSSNIAKLCPNCHRALDRDDAKIIEGVRAALLYRVSKAIFDRGGNREKIKKELTEKITPIMMHRRNNRTK